MSNVDGNPKDAAGRAKVPLHLWPASATAYGAVGLAEGMMKYGRNNWRGTKVHASIYVAALMRHVSAWMEGEDNTKEGGPHLGNALACLAILVDADVNGTLVDDRNFVPDPLAHERMMSRLTEGLKRLEGQFGEVHPHHWTFTSEQNKRPAKATTSRWKAMQETAEQFVRDISKIDADGIGLVVFSGSSVDSFESK